MASNKLPTYLDELAMLAEDAADGAHQLETTLGLKQNTEAAIRADLADLTARRSAYDTVASDSAVKGTAVTVARSNARAFLTSARDLFKNFFGAKAVRGLGRGGLAGQLHRRARHQRIAPAAAPVRRALPHRQP